MNIKEPAAQVRVFCLPVQVKKLTKSQQQPKETSSNNQTAPTASRNISWPKKQNKTKNQLNSLGADLRKSGLKLIESQGDGLFKEYEVQASRALNQGKYHPRAGLKKI